jgi:DNA repair exonuclease SbcCD ATPase subunit
MRILLLVLFAVQAAATAVAAQSLGDVARQEEARRKAVTTAGKVYTNDNLRSDGSTAVPSAAASTGTPAADAVANPGTADKADTGDKALGPKKDQAYWQNRVKSERDALSRAQLFAESLQSRINALTTDFSARDDPYQRNQVAQDRQKALAELDRVHKEIADHTKAIADIQEEARKAGVPAGWAR